MFLTFQMRDPKAGIDMAKVALALNPTCSAELWNTLGDGLYEFGRTAEARSAYLKAQSVNPSDVRSRYNLAWVYTREKNFRPRSIRSPRHCRSTRPASFATAFCKSNRKSWPRRRSGTSTNISCS